MCPQTMVCVPIFRRDLNSAEKTVNKALKLGADMVELRIDALKNPDVDKIITFIDNLECRAIATNRMAREGGLFGGSENERTTILKDVAKHADYVDIEFATDYKIRNKVVKSSKKSIISYHNFKKTPSIDDLLKIVKLEKEIGDLAKIAVMPQNMGDSLRVLEVLLQVNDTITISMGELGRYTRVTAPLFGSPITYASLDDGSAPGQMDIESTKLFLRKFGGE